jgi:hypothetical protein
MGDLYYSWSKINKKCLILYKKKRVGSPTVNLEQTKTVLKYLQKVRNETNKWPDHFKMTHKAVSLAKEIHNKTSLPILPIGINNNHPKEVKVVKAL